MAGARPFSSRTLRDWGDMSQRSAEAVLPLVIALGAPRSAVDVGCLYGAWAAECRRLGMDDVLGIDGDYIDRAQLRIPEAGFLAHDLARPLRIERTFDLAISLEVAHYL